MKNLWAAVALALFAIPCHAAEYTWSGGASGSADAWRNANHWTPATSAAGPGSGDIAVFSTNGTAHEIAINFNDGRGLVAPVGSIVLAAGGNRTIYNSSANSSGTLLIEGAGGLLLANHAATATLSFSNGPGRATDVHLANGGRIEVLSSGAGILIGSKILGSAGFVKTGSGWLRLTGSNSLTGPVVVAGGLLELAGDNSPSLGSASAIRVQTGATLRLVTGEQIGSGTSLQLAGGTLRGAHGPAAVVERAGPLTLSATSTIDLGSSSIHLADSSMISWAPSSLLVITNWHGASGGGGRLFFGVGGLTSAQLGQIYFSDLGIHGAQLVGPDGELVPVPEATVFAAAACLSFFILWRERCRLIRVVRRSFAG